MLDTLDATKDVLRTAIENRPPPRTSLDQLMDFWRSHPFLVGWFGADVVDKLKRC